MFFVLSKLLSFFLNPLIWVTGFLLLSLFKKEKRKQFLIIGISLFYLFSMPLISNLLIFCIETPPQQIKENKHYDIAIILTGVLSVYDSIPYQVNFSDGVDRFSETMRLYHEKKVKKIIISGGSGKLLKPKFKESEVMGYYAKIFGVKEEDLFLETMSKNTYENALYTNKILQTHFSQDANILLITSSFHMKRAKKCFEKQAIKFDIYPVDFILDYGNIELFQVYNFIPNASSINDFQKAIREIIGLIAYKFLGYI